MGEAGVFRHGLTRTFGCRLVDTETTTLFHSGMHVTVKVLIVAVMFSLASAARSELVWEKTELELHPAVGDETAIGHFKYENKGDKQIAIKSVTTSCGCTAASAKQTADPKEKGEVTATFKIGDRTGVQQKTINVVTDDPAHPTTALMLKVTIPTVLELQPTFVYWQSGEEPKPKTIIAKVGAGVAIKNLEAVSSHPDFTAKVEKGKAKDEFQINIAPRQTTQAVAATLTIKPTLEKGTKILYASARVMPPAPTNVAPANTPAANTPAQPMP
jgi:hypothetical protein